MKHTRQFPVWELVLIGMLLLTFMDFKLYSLHLMVLSFVYFGVIRGRLCLPNGVVPLVLLTFVLFIFWPASLFSPTALAKRLVWPAAFLLGYNLILPRTSDSQSAEKAESRANIYFFLAVAGFFIHLVLNLYVNAGQIVQDRNTLDFWSMQRRAATGQAGLACVPLAWSISNIIKEETFFKKVPAILVLGTVMYYNLTLGSRTVVFSFAVIFAVALIYFINAKATEKNKGRALFWVVIACILCVLVYSGNVGGIRELVENSILSNRLMEDGSTQITQDSRWARKLKYVMLMPQYMFGGSNIYRSVGGFAHDVLLDTYDEAGVFAFLAVIALLWDSISKLGRLLKSNQVQFDTKLTLLCIYLAVLIEFTVEPIFAGMPWLLMVFCFFHGIVTRLVKNTATAIYYNQTVACSN